MLFKQMIKRFSVDIAEFIALLFAGAFIYNQTVPFVKAAVSLGYVNVQAVTYVFYSLLLLLFPLAFLWHPLHFDKGRWLRILFYAFSACIFVGTVSDLITYRGFIGYTYSEGDLVFTNILWNIPNILGALFSILIAVLYAVLGKQIRRKRRISFVIYMIIFVLTAAVPFLYTYSATGFLPRATWLQKAAFNIPEQLLMLIALSISASECKLWTEYIWN